MDVIYSLFSSFTSLILVVIVLFIIIKVLSLPIKLLYNGIMGAIMLWLANLVGGLFSFHIHITVIKALIAGFFGIPGAAAVILWELFSH